MDSGEQTIEDWMVRERLRAQAREIWILSVTIAALLLVVVMVLPN